MISQLRLLVDPDSKLINIFVHNDEAQISTNNFFLHGFCRGILNLLVSVNCTLCCSKVQPFSFYADRTFPPWGPKSETKQNRGRRQKVTVGRQ